MQCDFFPAVLANHFKFLVFSLNLEKAVERGIIVQDIGFTVLSKNFSSTLRLSGHFLEVLWNQ
jgi:hypothetical protein